MLDEDLSWNSHITYVTNKLLKYVALFYKIRNNLTLECRKALYFALVYPHLVYAVELFGTATAKNLNSLQILQNKLLRVLQIKRTFTHNNELFTEFDTFKIRDLYELNLLKLAHKIVHHTSQLPSIFHDYLTFNHNIHSYNTRHKNDIFVHQIHTTLGSKAFTFKSHQLWNTLPKHIKEISSLSLFSSRIKSLYKNKYI